MHPAPTSPFDSPLDDGPHHLPAWEVALDTTSRLAVVFALSLALILILAHRV